MQNKEIKTWITETFKLLPFVKPDGRIIDNRKLKPKLKWIEDIKREEGLRLNKFDVGYNDALDDVKKYLQKQENNFITAYGWIDKGEEVIVEFDREFARAS